MAIPIQILATKIRVGVYEQDPEVDLFIAFFESYFQIFPNGWLYPLYPIVRLLLIQSYTALVVGCMFQDRVRLTGKQ